MQAFVDLDAARRSREWDKKETNRFYDEQAKILVQWRWGEKPPADLIIGSLPQVNLKAIRLDRD